MKTVSNHLSLVFLLAFMTSVTPLAIDAYLPSMPSMANSLSVSIQAVEQTLSIFLIFYALGMILGGILSDRIGRKVTSLIGLSIFSLSSFALFFSSTIEQVYILRAIQAFFGALAVVNSAAVVRDLFHGKEAAKVFSTIASIMMIAPMLAPALGSMIITFFTWNYIFLFLALYSFIVSIFIYFYLPKTGNKTQTKVLQAYKKVLFHKKAIAYILSLAFAFSGMFIFIEKSSFIYMEHFKISEQVFPFLFGANVFVMIILTRINIKLVQKIEPSVVLKFGVLLQVFGGVLLLFASFSDNLVFVFISMMIFVGSLGLTFGNAMSCALEYFKKDSGVANSVIGVTEFTLAGIIGFLASMLPNESLTPIFIMMLCTALLSFFSLRIKG